MPSGAPPPSSRSRAPYRGSTVAISRASRTSARPLQYCSQQPRFPQPHRRPSGTTRMCPNSAPMPKAAAVQRSAEDDAAPDAGADRQTDQFRATRVRLRSGTRPRPSRWHRSRPPPAARRAWRPCRGAVRRARRGWGRTASSSVPGPRSRPRRCRRSPRPRPGPSLSTPEHSSWTTSAMVSATASGSVLGVGRRVVADSLPLVVDDAGEDLRPSDVDPDGETHDDACLQLLVRTYLWDVSVRRASWRTRRNDEPAHASMQATRHSGSLTGEVSAEQARDVAAAQRVSSRRLRSP